MGKSRSSTSGPSTLTGGGGDDTTMSDRQWCEGEGTGEGRKEQQDNEWEVGQKKRQEALGGGGKGRFSAP